MEMRPFGKPLSVLRTASLSDSTCPPISGRSPTCWLLRGRHHLRQREFAAARLTGIRLAALTIAGGAEEGRGRAQQKTAASDHAESSLVSFNP
jgi:hypothetical protein